jgi:hypothetical protein
MIKALWLMLTAVISMLTAILVVVSDGNFVLGIAFVGLLAIIGVTAYRLDWGLLIFLFIVLVFDQFNILSVDIITSKINYFANLNIFPGAPRWLVLSPLELHLILLVFLWVVKTAVAKEPVAPAPALTPMALIFFSAMAGSAAYGLSHGGDLIAAIWELRSLFYLIIFFFLIPQIIKTDSQLHLLVWVIVAGVSIKAIQGTYRFASYGFSFGSWPNIVETFTNHEDPVFFVLLFILLAGFLLLKTGGRQRSALLVLLLPLLLGYVAAQRRATYASFAVALVGFFLIMPADLKKRLSKIGLVLGVVFGMYLAMYWNSYSRVGSLAQQIKSTVTDEAGVRGEKDVISKLYRKAENFNLATTFRAAPVLGVGFGKEYLRPLRPWGSTFALSEYIPHNQIFWVFIKMGTLGGFIFWFFFNLYVLQGSILFVRLTDPYLKVVCAVCVIAVMNQFVVSFVDMQLTYARNMILLGVLMGVLQVLDAWSMDRTSAAQSISQ